MLIGSPKSAGNIAINRGSILLLFTDHQAEIARDWRSAKKPDPAKDNPDAVHDQPHRARRPISIA